MQTHTTISAVRTALASHRTQTIALVPTMGALHEGHLSLIRAARQQADLVVATIFVNPLQFAPTEDLARYPRTFAADQTLLATEGVDHLFAPSTEEMYPPGAQTCVEVTGLGDRLDGASRPGHFRGVATVVAKLFHIVQPNLAFFGQKDAAQVAVLRAMVRDLNFSVELIVCPTVRDPDGLALSSRNRYLTPEERTHALTLSRALQAVEQATTTDPAQLRQLLLNALHHPALALDYAEIVDPATLLPVHSLTQGALVAVAAKIGQTRLIDNLLLPPNP